MEKRFKIYSIILAIIYFAIVIVNIQSHISAFKLGFEEGSKGKAFSLYHIKIKPSSGEYTFPDLGINLKTGENMKLEAKEYMIYMDNESAKAHSLSFKIIKSTQLFTSLLFIAIVLYIPILFFQIIRSVIKGEIIEQKNIKRIARMGWLLFIYFIFNTLLYGIGDVYANKQILQLSNYDIIYDFSDMTLLILSVVTLLFSQILGLALKMKEEQDLTI